MGRGAGEKLFWTKAMTSFFWSLFQLWYLPGLRPITTRLGSDVIRLKKHKYEASWPDSSVLSLRPNLQFVFRLRADPIKHVKEVEENEKTTCAQLRSSSSSGEGTEGSSFSLRCESHQGQAACKKPNRSHTEACEAMAHTIVPSCKGFLLDG